ncbi:hypothetical protein LTR37_007563 [Vermiconidia calcicola]|uniref:Uncharacterized protein n=1 Tax=Vermiconidia calcicola TaxID=1690605 RepID=A0ACC3NDD9_9PEZI|nr:hypothetical protein LTR37_007563 [Vermiconidia calcicola]
MPLPFSEICILLSRLEEIELLDPPIFNPAEKYDRIKEVTLSWFKSHRRAINELSLEDAVAFISTFLPERRTDRVYGVQAPRLCKTLSRCLSLSAARAKDLQAYKQSGHGDLARCVERVLTSGGPPGSPRVELADVDEMLEVLASQSRFSDPSIQRIPPGSSEARDDLLGHVFKRASPSEGKWLVRLILKDFSPVKVNESLLLKSFHFLLPDLLQFQNDFTAVISLLKGPLREYPDSPDPRSVQLHRKSAAQYLKPSVGVKVGRPNFMKVRAIDHCMNMLGREQCVLERKYDGEYCEIHIDLTKSVKVAECITIFSKSGKDSTSDRRGIHQTLVNCLRLGRPDCKIKQRAILLGELVVYSDLERQIMPFEEIRKHVSRSGSFIGTNRDSQPKLGEHLAIVFFDILLLDIEVIMSKPIEERRMWLREIYTKIGGRAMTAEWKVVDFSDVERAKKLLVIQFAASIAERCEGLVLKPCGVPYFALGSGLDGRAQSYIKLKKDYIADLGDEADFAVIGGSYSAQQALKSGVPNLRWTDFHLGCLLNKCDVLRFDARPRYRVVGTIRQEACIPRPVLEAANAVGQFCAKPYRRGTPPANFDLDIDNATNMDFIFAKPFVFEVLGSGFEKPSNCSFYMLRHARVKKLHQDRTWKDCVSFQELQQQAAASRAAPYDSESQETRRWVEKIEKRCKKKFERERTATPRSRSAVTPSTVGTTAMRSCRQSQNTQTAAKPMRSAVRASPSRSLLEGTTLVGGTSPKRKRSQKMQHATPCPAAKKLCIGPAPASETTKRWEAAGSSATTAAVKGPLSDITNKAPRPQAGYQESKTIKAKDASDGILKRLSNLFRTSKPSPLIQEHSPFDGVDIEDQTNQCSTSKCLFANAVLYLSPCIANTPYITHDLLQLHNITTIPALVHWDRDYFAHPPMTETVAESQAYEGLRKVVLVEMKRRRAVRNTVKQILELNDGAFRERIDVYDWRVLEACSRHDLISAEWKKFFLGATMFDEGRGRAMFVSNGVGCDW